jgi:mevalonate kinase
VIYGAQAIAMPVRSVGMRVTLTPCLRRDLPVTIKASLGGRGVSDHLKSVLFEAFEILGVQPFSLELSGSSTGLIGAGLGSSATLCIVILKSISGALGISLNEGQLATLGNQLERHFHGNPSGLDTSVVAYEKTICFRKGAAPEVISVELSKRESLNHWPFVLLDSHTRSSTIAMVKGVAPFFLGQEGLRRVQKFDQLAHQVKVGLETSSVRAVADAMKEAGSLLKQAGASSLVLDDLVDLCSRLGALAAKPTGAGGGGCVLAFLDPARSDEQKAMLVRRLGSSRVIDVHG